MPAPAGTVRAGWLEGQDGEDGLFVSCAVEHGERGCSMSRPFFTVSVCARLSTAGAIDWTSVPIATDQHANELRVCIRPSAHSILTGVLPPACLPSDARYSFAWRVG